MISLQTETAHCEMKINFPLVFQRGFCLPGFIPYMLEKTHAPYPREDFVRPVLYLICQKKSRPYPGEDFVCRVL